jgi:steroid 5-alpha reductase family enzyme
MASGLLFWLYAICVVILGKDDRFDDKREDCLKFFVFWVFQMVWVFTVSLPVIFVNSARLAGTADFPTGWDIFGGVLFLTGFIVETIADFQKFAFKENELNRGRWCDAGKDGLGLWL